MGDATTVMAVGGSVLVAFAFVVAVGCRCRLGFHPADAVRLRPGVRNRKTGRVEAEWWCEVCGQVAGTTTTKQPLRMQQTLQKQKPAALARSRKINLHVVKKEDVA